jgi:uncharacterized protein
MLDFNLRDRTILLTVAGSRAYGIHTAESDLDIKGVLVPPVKYYLGTQKIEQVEGDRKRFSSFRDDLTPEQEQIADHYGMEGTIFELRKFLKLAAGANPNILDVLFCRDSDVIYSTAAGQVLRQNRQKFLTKKCLHTFVGYATAQAHRIETHRKWLLDPPDHEPTREEFELPARHLYPQDQVKAALDKVRKQVDRWSIDFRDVEESTKIFIQDQIYKQLAEINVGSEERFTAACNLLGFETNFMELVHKQRKYDDARSKWKSYQSWKKGRNKARAGMEKKVGHDVKHAAHLWRLTSACRTIFETGDLMVYSPDPYVLAIRRGEVAFDKLMARFYEQKADLSRLAVNSTLPDRVDSDWLEELSVGIVGEMIKKEI